jgi:hypothetical protein
MPITQNIKRYCNKLRNTLAAFPAKWSGKKAIMEMKKAGYPHWRQMEWIGFYFQFLCDTRLADVMDIPGPRMGKAEFDGFAQIPWDFKVHPEKNAKGQKNKSVIVNDMLAIEQGIAEYGAVGIILGTGDATYNDVDRSFQLWHKALKGGLSAYEDARIARGAPSRLRKTAFVLQKIEVLILEQAHLMELPSFQKGFRNSNGKPRNEKVLLPIDAIPPIITVEL